VDRPRPERLDDGEELLPVECRLLGERLLHGLPDRPDRGSIVLDLALQVPLLVRRAVGRAE
jgi:hypothetical protein